MKESASAELSREPIWIGIHDYRDTIERWLDPDRSCSWLNAFERAKNFRKIAFCGTRSRDLDISSATLDYRFRSADIDGWCGEIVQLKPHLILWNICYYEKALECLANVKSASRDSLNITRLHHEINYLSHQPGFLEFMLSSDVVIVPDEQQSDDCRRLGFRGCIFVLPFGVNTDIFHSRTRNAHEVDIVSAANGHPGRNLGLVGKVYDCLKAGGVTGHNLQGLSRRDLARSFRKARFFWLTSMTEASGGRVLAEAISCGCIPIVFEECSTASRLLRKLGYGYIIKSGIRYKYSTKTLGYPPLVLDDLVKSIFDIIKSPLSSVVVSLPKTYLEYVEAEELLKILLYCYASHRRISAGKTYLSTKHGCFNAAIFYHDDLDRSRYGVIARSLTGAKRSICIADYDWGSSDLDFLSLSENIKDFEGNEIIWQADPRVFNFEATKFLIFNTGHSSIPNQQYIVDLTDLQAQSKGAKRIIYQNRRLVEKNWGIFSCQGSLWAIYSIAPFKVLRLNDNGKEYIASDSFQFPWNSGSLELYGELRGGTSPILIGEKFFFLYQQHLLIGDRKNYLSGALWFEHSPPFRPLRVTKFPLFSLSPDERRMRPDLAPNIRAGDVFYPTGALYDEEVNTVILSYGINDFQFAIAEFNYSDILDASREINWCS